MKCERMTGSSSLLRRWRGVGVGLVSALTLAPVNFAIGVLVFGWALELVVGALVETVK